MKLLSIGSNTKIIKSDKSGQGYLTAILHLAPADISGRNVCAWSTDGCRKACLNTAGRGVFGNVQKSRIAKTKLFFEDRERFFALLVTEITALIKRCDKLGVKPAVRLNGTSDILFERIAVGEARNIFELFPQVQFYDYTKAPPAKRRPQDNYHLTYSRASDAQKSDLVQALHGGQNIAVVFDKELPAYYWGYPVVSGEETDLRFLDGKGVVVGLVAKGMAKKDTSGFVVMAA